MTSPPEALDPQLLLAQTDWVRDLARRLVHDASRADDVAQETMLAAITRPPKVDGSEDRLRAWLTRVAHNLARLGQRGDARRRHREQHVARDEQQPATSEVVERAAQLRRVVEATLALEEPYRTAVLLSCHDGLDSRQIAARTGASPQAVRKRISRGLAKLRDRLDRESGGQRQRWVQALAPLVGTPQPAAAAAAIGVSLMSGKFVVATAGAVALCLLAWVALDWPPAELDSPATGAAVTPAATSANRRAPADEEAHAAKASPRRTEVDENAARGATLNGRVVSAADATGLPNVEVFLAHGDDPLPVEGARPVTATDANGAFAMPRPAALDVGLLFRCQDHFDVHVAPAEIPRHGEDPLHVRLAPLGVVLVRVVDERGTPLANQDVHYEVDPTLGSEQQRWHWRRRWSAGLTDAQGEVRVGKLPVGMPINFSVGNTYAPSGHLVLDPGLRYAEIEITPRNWAQLRGQLMWEGGAPAAGVELSWHGTSDASGWQALTKSDPDGRFAFPALGAGRGALFFAGGERSALACQVATGAPTDLGTVILKQPASVSGRVVAADGAGVQGLQVEAFREGGRLAAVAVEPSGAFSMRISPGPTALLVTRRSWWDPILPYTPHAHARVMVEAPATDLEIEIDLRQGSLFGTLEESPSGDVEITVLAFSPIQDADARQPEPSGDAVVQHSTKLTDRTVMSPQLPPGRYRLLVDVPEFGRAYSAEAEAMEGQPRDAGALRFGTGTISGQLLDDGGHPVADTSVEAIGYREAAQVVRTDGQGQFTFARLAAGPWLLRVLRGSAVTAAPAFAHLEAGARVEVALVGRALATLAGRVVTPDGPAASRGINVQQQESNRIWTATTGPDGTFEVEDLEPGRYRFWMRDAFVHTATLAPGETTDFEIHLDAHRAEVEVRAGNRRLTEIESMSVAGAVPGSSDYLWWRKGRRLGAGLFEVDVPAGLLVFMLDVPGLGNNQVVMTSAPAAQGQATLVLQLPETGIELDLAATSTHAPLPAAYLLELATGPIESIWGTSAELQVERDLDGRVRFPYLPAGALVRLVGTGSDGGRVSREVRVAPAGWTRVAW